VDRLEPLNAWIGHLFDRRNVDRTVAALVASQDGGGKSSERETAKKRLADAEMRLRRFRDAIGAGVDPDTLVEAINEAQAQRAASQAGLDGRSRPDRGYRRRGLRDDRLVG
jgi:hypothetical protein